MARLNWSDDKRDGDGLVEFADPKSDMSVRTFPNAVVYFPSGSRVVGVETTVEQRRV